MLKKNDCNFDKNKKNGVGWALVRSKLYDIMNFDLRRSTVNLTWTGIINILDYIDVFYFKFKFCNFYVFFCHHLEP